MKNNMFLDYNFIKDDHYTKHLILQYIALNIVDSFEIIKKLKTKENSVEEIKSYFKLIKNSSLKIKDIINSCDETELIKIKRLIEQDKVEYAQDLKQKISHCNDTKCFNNKIYACDHLIKGINRTLNKQQEKNL